MKSIKTALVLMATMLGLAGSALPAEAGTYNSNGLTLTTTDVVYTSDDCFYSKYSLSGLDPENSYDLTVTDPYGAVADEDFFYGQTSGSGRAFLCKGMDPVGRYSITVEAEDPDGNPLPGVSGSFTVRNLRKASSAIAVSRSTAGAHSWRIRGHLTRSGKAWGGRPVVIQARVNGTWYNISRKRTDSRGNVHWRSTPQQGAGQYWIRVHSNGNRTTKAANSRLFKLPYRG